MQLPLIKNCSALNLNKSAPRTLDFFNNTVEREVIKKITSEYFKTWIEVIEKSYGFNDPEDYCFKFGTGCDDLEKGI